MAILYYYGAFSLPTLTASKRLMNRPPVRSTSRRLQDFNTPFSRGLSIIRPTLWFDSFPLQLSQTCHFQHKHRRGKFSPKKTLFRWTSVSFSRQQMIMLCRYPCIL
ncbi:unnamed protein product [Kuraishia capsulata CBS 1993]|uniref:Uncharacterized protein n=1 Tax=Kuraishia capsulata CBS 1993 TaxID=1382522 RepID=W6MNN3_9ASCO|nr:uncharacterized protein KUCA_T00002641001 [Kuraishia capsulata CBS 1993]CDK26667.1 unnamed protein product [Kuraishia capsulata CBS 1993]